MSLWEGAFLAIAGCWVAFAAVAVWGYFRVQRERRETGAREEPSLRSPAAMWGLLVEMAAYAVVWFVRRPALHETPAGWLWAAMTLAPASVLFFTLAVRELGLHFRIRAVVAADHALVTSGPYGVVRHPIYASMLGLLVSNAMLVSRWEAALGALAIFLIGTEIRVRAEEGLLERRFPEDYRAYRRRVRAYVPFVR